jgi:carboxyl-terminal processing protease
MRHSKIKICTLTALLCALVVIGCRTVQKKTTPPPAPIPPAASLSPGPNDARIAYLTGLLMANLHYSQEALDPELSAKFYDGYLESLDPRRENFLQSDIDEFAHYRTNLDRLTAQRNGRADLTPAFEIYQRFIERLQEHDAYVEDLLKQDKFKFTGNDRILIDRRHAPYPQDLDEAKELWREQLRYQYLQEKLSRELSATNSNMILPLTKTNYTDIADTLARHYRWNTHYYTNWDSTDVLQAYLEALTHAYDPHSDYLNDEHAQDFSIQMSLALFGIGAQLAEDDGYCTISRLIPGGPAAKSKQLNEKDRVVAVAQGSKPPVDVVDMELGKVVQLIRGAKGTEVRLTISPGDDHTARRVVTLIRDEIKLEDSESKATLIETPKGHGGTNRIGMILVPSFYTPIDLPGNAGHAKQSYVSTDVAKLIQKLKSEKVDGIILDLRNNPGGSLEEAVKFTGLFIKSGPIVLAKDSNGQISVDADPDPSVLYDGPLAVMINRFSASAAEIAAAALQDYGRAIIVGDISTHGKGTVQNLNSLKNIMVNSTTDPGTLKISIRKFYRINGASTQLKGVVPDVILPDIWNYSDEIGETSLENPLPWDTISTDNIPGAKYDKLNLVEPYLTTLRQNSDARIATNQDFIYINQDIELFKKLQADKTASLNEHDQIKETQSTQARLKARNMERDARKPLDTKNYEITVENSDQPGLPEPMPLTISKTNGDIGLPRVSYTIDSKFEDYFKTNTTSALGVVTNLNSTMKGSELSKDNSAPIITTSPVPPDPMLNETVSILEDYISLLSASHTLIAK